MALSHLEMLLTYGLVFDLSYSMGKDASVAFQSIYENMLIPINNPMNFKCYCSYKERILSAFLGSTISLANILYSLNREQYISRIHENHWAEKTK